MKRNNVRFLTQAALIAAMYVVLTFVANALGLASGVVQFRLAEVLTVLPFFTAAAIPGLTIGCLLANLLTGCVLWDIIFGTLATLIGAYCSHLLRRHKWLVPLPPILANSIIVPFVLAYAYGLPGSIWFFALTVAIGEIVMCGVLGMPLLLMLDKRKSNIFVK